jgi:drug/metabolite transporter (DMT)-like permease
MRQTDTHEGDSACQVSQSVEPLFSEKSAARAVRKGILLCLASTCLYSFSNVCLRQLGEVGVDYRWSIFIKECVCIGTLTPLILYWVIRRRYQWPALKWVVYILFGGFCCQYVGARLHLHAFAVIGLLVSVPLVQASTMIFSAGIGRGFIGERISGRSFFAMAVMLVAMICLIFGPSQPASLEHSTKTLAESSLLLAGLGTILAGMAYAIHVVCIRMARKGRQMPITFIAVQVTAIGAVIFGFEFLRDNDFQISIFWENIPASTWFYVLASGVLNMAGFVLQIAGLRYTLVARAQMISLAQIVIGTLFGVFFFGEMTNLMIWLGVLLTVLGIIIVSTPGKRELVQETL